MTTLAIVILFTRPLLGHLGDRLGYKRVFVPCLVLITAGIAVLSFGGTRGLMVLSALIFGIGFLMPLFTARRQALHDLAANTIVTVKPPAPAPLAMWQHPRQPYPSQTIYPE